MSSAESSWSNMPRELENQKLKHPHSLAILAKNISRSLLSRENYILPLFPREAGGERQRRDGRTDGQTERALRPLGAGKRRNPGMRRFLPLSVRLAPIHLRSRHKQHLHPQKGARARCVTAEKEMRIAWEKGERLVASTLRK